MANKILLFGPPAAGKTTLRKFFFDGVNPSELLKKKELPTIGLNYQRYGYVYKYPIHQEHIQPEKHPFQLVVVDSAGQEIQTWLKKKDENVFSALDMLLFVFDISQWNDPDQGSSIRVLFKNTFTSASKHSPGLLIYILGHKIDKVAGSGEYKEKLRNKIEKEISHIILDASGKLKDFEVYLTSIMDPYKNETFSTLFLLLTRLISKKL